MKLDPWNKPPSPFFEGSIHGADLCLSCLNLFSTQIWNDILKVAKEYLKTSFLSYNVNVDTYPIQTMTFTAIWHTVDQIVVLTKFYCWNILDHFEKTGLHLYQLQIHLFLSCNRHVIWQEKCKNYITTCNSFWPVAENLQISICV